LRHGCSQRAWPGPSLLTGRQSRGSLAVASPDTRRSTSDRVSEISLFPDSAGNKGRFAQPTVRFPIFGINDNMLVVVWGLGVLRRVSGESPARPARAPGVVSERTAGGLIIVIRQPHHRGFSASHWHPGTSVSENSRRLDGAESLLGVQICIPGSVRVRPPWCMGVLRQFSRCSCTTASSSPRLKADLRRYRTFSLFFASRALSDAFTFKFGVGG
jgi:hypothetical protein